MTGIAIGPQGQIRPSDPAANAQLTVRIATGEIDERGAVDEVTRGVLVDPDARLNERRLAWQLRRERHLDALPDIMSLWDYLRAWGGGRISYRQVIDDCQLGTLEGLLDAAFHSQAPFGKTTEEETAIAFVETIRRTCLSREDELTASAILADRRLGVVSLAGLRDDELLAGLREPTADYHNEWGPYDRAGSTMMSTPPCRDVE